MLGIIPNLLLAIPFSGRARHPTNPQILPKTDLKYVGTRRSLHQAGERRRTWKTAPKWSEISSRSAPMQTQPDYILTSSRRELVKYLSCADQVFFVDHDHPLLEQAIWKLLHRM